MKADLTQCNCYIPMPGFADAQGNKGAITRCSKPAEVWQILDDDRSVIGRCLDHAHPETTDKRTRWNVRNVTYKEALVWQVMQS